MDESFRRLSGGLRRIAGDDAPDCVQEAFARAHLKGVPLDAEPWVRTVAKRIAIDKLRRSHEYASGGPVELEGFVRDHDGDPQEAFVRAERSAEVRQALEQLPPRYRDALLTYAEEDSPAAVASRLGLSATAAWTLLSRARSRLRVQLEQVGYAPVAFLSRVRWRGYAIGGATVAAAAVTATTIVPHYTQPQVPARPATILEQASAPTVSVAPLPKKTPTPAALLAVPQISAAVTKLVPTALPTVSPPVDLQKCTHVPVPTLAPVTDTLQTIVGAVTSKVPQVGDVAKHVCP